MDTPYISHSQRRSAPATMGPELRVDQNRVVIAGSTKAWNTAAGERRISIPTFTVGVRVSCEAVPLPEPLLRAPASPLPSAP